MPANIVTIFWYPSDDPPTMSIHLGSGGDHCWAHEGYPVYIRLAAVLMMISEASVVSGGGSRRYDLTMDEYGAVMEGV